MSTNGPEKGNPTSSREIPSASPSPSGEIHHLERFATTFQASARRWEMIVYPSMLAFIVLAVYGFYLVYSLTRDMHSLSTSMDPDMQPHMDTLAVSVTKLSGSVDTMSKQVVKMTESVQSMDKTMIAINANITIMRQDMSRMTRSMDHMKPMLVNLSEMNTAMHRINDSVVAMSMTMGRIGHDVGAASYQFTRPMSVINSFAPW
uniref:Uncharacterized protein n=1 Tax=Candidatus Kentrum sp. MB TaxID=2138164 RepID=A0A450XS30_9GAMM|nr:MAG: hypothetical protein BECKMB1821G_GA0114241_102829 [Candidatus Kentron sp. MB]VFK32077.1 MAG: hypothetical protein BECKMB1821I_GA0114274_102928 [Candidatus Kentron sp. MB]VFK75656.1 MAG: hypothetical protein BECKMB1821H_GA0114242_102820 [Candidatus Kentron sp. MB]